MIVVTLELSGSGHLECIAMDSHEAGTQNWINKFIEKFTVRRGYDPTLYLPSMMRYIMIGVKKNRMAFF
ncbi:glycosyl hydrolase [Flavobacterium hydrophilum]|uniref:glycosyl hydrolase n=1 Tax=Flavobacterium hydrophilum TaxID=2211445 RepID=UPI001402191D|nr:glycosyl hydrolase [Flavobacterium hydrophilum]